MIAFDFNIHFKDETSLDDGLYDSNKKDFMIVKSSDLSAFQQLTVGSEYMPMSGRQARYASEKPFSLCQEGCSWGVEVKDVASFIWRCGEHSIAYIPQQLLAPELLQFWILHTILPMALALEKTYEILHVGAVEVNGEPILFSAESFGGKSTMTDYFLKQGHTLLSDDTLGVYKKNGDYVAVASYPFHRPYRKAESLGDKVVNVSTHPKPIKAIFLLEKSEARADVAIEELKGIEKYKAFHFSTFINFDFLQQHRFQLLGEMANTLPVYKVSVPWDITRIDEVYHSIITY